jgi:hypothetical protein
VFAGIAPPTLRLFPLETHIAEKPHAYTLRWSVVQRFAKSVAIATILPDAGSARAAGQPGVVDHLKVRRFSEAVPRLVLPAAAYPS